MYKERQKNRQINLICQISLTLEGKKYGPQMMNCNVSLITWPFLKFIFVHKNHQNRFKLSDEKSSSTFKGPDYTGSKVKVGLYDLNRFNRLNKGQPGVSQVQIHSNWNNCVSGLLKVPTFSNVRIYCSVLLFLKVFKCCSDKTCILNFFKSNFIFTFHIINKLKMRKNAHPVSNFAEMLER